MTPDTSQWRVAERYDYIGAISAAELAWEWLRRNTRYQIDHRDHARTLASQQRHSPDTVTWPTCWGLRFPDQTQRARHRHANLLDTVRPHRRRPAGPHPVRPA